MVPLYIICFLICGDHVLCTIQLQVLQHLMDGLISFAFKPEDLQCSLFRYIVRELLACAVMRPVLNLASPRYPFLLVCFMFLSALLLYHFSSTFLVIGLLMKELNCWS